MNLVSVSLYGSQCVSRCECVFVPCYFTYIQIQDILASFFKLQLQFPLPISPDKFNFFQNVLFWFGLVCFVQFDSIQFCSCRWAVRKEDSSLLVSLLCISWFAPFFVNFAELGPEGRSEMVAARQLEESEHWQRRAGKIQRGKLKVKSRRRKPHIWSVLPLLFANLYLFLFFPSLLVARIK